MDLEPFGVSLLAAMIMCQNGWEYSMRLGYCRSWLKQVFPLWGIFLTWGPDVISKGHKWTKLPRPSYLYSDLLGSIQGLVSETEHVDAINLGFPAHSSQCGQPFLHCLSVLPFMTFLCHVLSPGLARGRILSCWHSLRLPSGHVYFWSGFHSCSCNFCLMFAV